jgi:hypothetical protein
VGTVRPDPELSADYVRAEADRWAAEFIERFRGRVVGDTVTKELLATWFANAMTTGSSHMGSVGE